jgi:hypothetical protein
VSLANELICYCGKVHPNAKLVTLPDGCIVGSYSEEYRLYCEAKWAFYKATNRHEYLLEVHKKRGLAAYHKLRDAMLEIHQEHKNALLPI